MEILVGLLRKPLCGHGCFGAETTVVKFRGRPSDAGGIYVDANGGDVMIEGCTFSNNCQDRCETVRLDQRLKSATIRNCVFHNVAKALSIETPLAVVQNSVFDSIAGYAISAPKALYANQPTNGHNLFFRVCRGFADKDQYNTSDIRDLDPGFVDPAQCDFRLKAGSPCLNAGLEVSDRKRSNIGAWQGENSGQEVRRGAKQKGLVRAPSGQATASPEPRCP